MKTRLLTTIALLASLCIPVGIKIASPQEAPAVIEGSYISQAESLSAPAPEEIVVDAKGESVRGTDLETALIAEIERVTKVKPAPESNCEDKKTTPTLSASSKASVPSKEKAPVSEKKPSSDPDVKSDELLDCIKDSKISQADLMDILKKYGCSISDLPQLPIFGSGNTASSVSSGKPSSGSKPPVSSTPAASSNTPPVASVPSNSSFEQQVADLVNEQRAAYGLSPLTLNTELSNVARIKSQDMKDKKYFDHNSPTYGSPFDMMKSFGITYRTAGENIAMGYTTPKAVMDGWMNSPGHRANILKASFTQIGVGYVAGGNYWTQMFIG